MQQQMQANTSRLAAIAACAAPVADDAPAEDIKVDPQQHSAIILHQDPNLTLTMQLMTLGSRSRESRQSTTEPSPITSRSSTRTPRPSPST
jgi:hypothetical protein